MPPFSQSDILRKISLRIRRPRAYFSTSFIGMSQYRPFLTAIIRPSAMARLKAWPVTPSFLAAALTVTNLSIQNAFLMTFRIS